MISFFLFGSSSSSFSPLTIVFYCGHEHDITSMKPLWSTHWFHCIMMINGDPNAASCFSLFLLLLGRFRFLLSHPHVHLKDCAYALMCVMPIHLKCMILVYFFWNHTNYCGANPDCSCHGNCLLGVMAPLKLKWNEKMRGSWGYTADTHTHTAHYVPTYFIFHLVSWRVLLAVYLDSKRCDRCALLCVNARKWIWRGWMGISVLSGPSWVPRGPRAETSSLPFIHCIKWMCWVQGGVSEI